jgi:Uma2 family endonuclease
MVQPGSKVPSDDALPAPEDMLPFSDVQAELCRLVTELTWPAVQLSFFRRSRRDKGTGKPRRDIDVFAGCLPCGVTLGCPVSSDALVPTLTIAADPGTEWHRLHHHVAKVSAEERARWLSKLAATLAERVNRTPCRCAGERNDNARREIGPQLPGRSVSGPLVRSEPTERSPMSTTKPSPRASTLADLDALPPGIVGEIIEGVLYTMTKPRIRHQRTTRLIGGRVGDPFDDGIGGPGGWWIVTEPGIELPNTPEISPDVAGWRRERMPEMPIDEPIRVVPDWVCEILSPRTRRHDLLHKQPYYAKIGVPFMWLVDIDARVLTAHQLDGDAWRIIGTYSDETEARIMPFDAVPLNVASWWPPAPHNSEAP